MFNVYYFAHIEAYTKSPISYVYYVTKNNMQRYINLQIREILQSNFVCFSSSYIVLSYFNMKIVLMH
ncbi:hypothetical protein D0T49_09370 [Paludibacter sp. 221]|nr:hypothetical protein [Paludibacter sp. 221]